MRTRYEVVMYRKLAVKRMTRTGRAVRSSLEAAIDEARFQSQHPGGDVVTVTRIEHGQRTLMGSAAKGEWKEVQA